MKGRHLHAQSFGVLRRRSRARNLSDWLAEEDASIEDKLSDLARRSLELPPAVDRAYRRLVASHDNGAGLLNVFAAHARYERGCVDEDEDEDDFHQVYVPTDRQSHARYIPGVGPALPLTRRRVCAALLNSERLSVIVKPATGSSFPAEVEPSAVLVNLLLAELPTVDVSPELEPDQPRNQDPLTLGNKATDPARQVAHQTRAGPATRHPKEEAEPRISDTRTVSRACEVSGRVVDATLNVSRCPSVTVVVGLTPKPVDVDGYSSGSSVTTVVGLTPKPSASD